MNRQGTGTRRDTLKHSGEHAWTVRASVPSGLHALVAVMVRPCEADQTNEM
jgi:hypothetical protein